MKLDNFTVLCLGLVFLATFFLMGAMIDESLDNKDRMLCESARVSGNEIYLDKCICFYAGGDISCIYKEDR